VRFNRSENLLSNHVVSIASATTIDGREPDAYVNTIGRARADHGFTAERVDIVVNLHVLVSGTLDVELDGQAFQAKTGDLFGVFPGSQLRFANTSGRPCNFCWILVHGLAAEGAVAMAGIERGQGRWGGGAWDVLQPMVKEISMLYAEDRQDLAYPVAAAWRIISQLALIRQTRETRPSPCTSAAATARTLLERHHELGVSISELAERLAVSRSTLFRQFRKAYGESPKQFLDRLRFERACQLLRETRASIKEIAHSSGFSSAQYFSQVFHERYRMPPGAWRDAQMAGTD
jgi:AraC-like DNA-binding protein